MCAWLCTNLGFFSSIWPHTLHFAYSASMPANQALHSEARNSRSLCVCEYVGSSDLTLPEAAGIIAALANMGSRNRARQPRSVHCCYRRASIFLRPLEPLAARKQREHERAATTVLPQGNGSFRCKPSSVRYCRQEIKYTTARDPALEDASVYAAHYCFDDPLSRSLSLL